MVSFFRFFLVSLVFTLGTTSTGHAASFDCNKATTEIEIAICTDPRLSELDENIASVYFGLNPEGRYFQQLVEAQRSWIKSERSAYESSFMKQHAFLELGSAMSGCLKNKSFDDCEYSVFSIYENCINSDSRTNWIRDRCGSAFVSALDLVERFETDLWKTLNGRDKETLNYFIKGSNLWGEFVDADCGFIYSMFRDGRMAFSQELGCRVGHLVPRISKLHRSNSISAGTTSTGHATTCGLFPDSQGRTTLHTFSKLNQPDNLKQLLMSIESLNLEIGCVDVVDENGETPLHFAAALGVSEAVLLLLDAGADKNIENFNGETPLDLAVSNEGLKFTDALIALRK